MNNVIRQSINLLVLVFIFLLLILVSCNFSGPSKAEQACFDYVAPGGVAAFYSAKPYGAVPDSMVVKYSVTKGSSVKRAGGCIMAGNAVDPAKSAAMFDEAAAEYRQRCLAVQINLAPARDRGYRWANRHYGNRDPTAEEIKARQVGSCSLANSRQAVIDELH